MGKNYLQNVILAAVRVLFCPVLLASAIFSAQAQPNAVDVRPYLDRAEQALQRNELEGALKELQEAVRLNGSEPEAHGALGIVFRKMGRLPEAAKALERAVELRPDPRLKVLLGFSHMDMGNFPAAIPLLTESFETEQKDTVKLIVGQRLVECLLGTGAEEQALGPVQKLRQMAPDDPNVLYLSSKVYMNLWNGAFQRILTKAPGSYHVRLIQAEALEAQGRFGEAAHEYREILKIAPRISDINYRLGRAILRSPGNEKADVEAQAAFQKELEANPFHIAALTEIGEIHLRKSEREEASRTFTQAIRLQPGDPRARVGLAKVLIGEKQWSRALEHLEIAAKSAPYEEAVHYNMMLAYRGLGRAADAKKAFDTFQRLKEQKQQASKADQK
jgi:tetratricopeptide (TPR) repeat protein